MLKKGVAARRSEILRVRLTGGGCVVSLLLTDDEDDLVAKELRLLKKDELLGIPAGVGRRDWGFIEAVDTEVGSPAGVLLRGNVFEVNLLRASEKDDLR